MESRNYFPYVTIRAQGNWHYWRCICPHLRALWLSTFWFTHSTWPLSLTNALIFFPLFPVSVNLKQKMKQELKFWASRKLLLRISSATMSAMPEMPKGRWRRQPRWNRKVMDALHGRVCEHQCSAVVTEEERRDWDKELQHFAQHLHIAMNRSWMKNREKSFHLFSI